jgi:DNA modification methylase
MLAAPLDELRINYRRVGDLKPYSNNARTHSKSQIRKIAESIRSFGFTNPILIDKENTIIAGHGRVEGAKILGLAQVPTIRLESLTPAQVRAYVIADNRLAEEAGWNKEILKIELQHLILDDEIDISLTGFEIAEVDLVLQEVNKADEVDAFEVDDRPVVSKPDDLWLLGRHRILCGSSLVDVNYERLMDGRKANVVFTDPPYNVRIDGHVCGNGATKHAEFAMASGEMTQAEFTEFLVSSFRRLEHHSKAGSVHFICMDWRHLKEIVTAGDQIYDSLLNVCVWVKDNGGMGSFYRSRHEMVFVFSKGGGTRRNNIQLGKFGRNRTNVWEYPGVNTLSKRGEEGNLLALHPTVKPTTLVADALLDCSAPKDIVLDGFLGSGTTLLAAERTGRSCFGIELTPKYVDVAIRRWQQHTGQQAVHAVSAKSFDALTQEREATHG